MGIEYVRVERPVGEGDWREVVCWAKDAGDAARMLSDGIGNVLLEFLDRA